MIYKDIEKRKAYHKKYQVGYRRKNGVQSFRVNKSCASFLGVHIAERMLSQLFNNIICSSYGTQGYDFICDKGYLIDVKSSCKRINNIKYKHKNTNNKTIYNWLFTINRNTIADYFLCIAFDNRVNLNPIHLWLIPGNVLSHLASATISETTIKKWVIYEKPIDKAISCCNLMR